MLTYGADLATTRPFRSCRSRTGPTLAPQPEQNTFFGWPLLLVLLAIVVWLWRRVAVRALALVAAVFAVLSLGATATWHGRPVLTPRRGGC